MRKILYGIIFTLFMMILGSTILEYQSYKHGLNSKTTISKTNENNLYKKL